MSTDPRHDTWPILRPGIITTAPVIDASHRAGQAHPDEIPTDAMLLREDGTIVHVWLGYGSALCSLTVDMYPPGTPRTSWPPDRRQVTCTVASLQPPARVRTRHTPSVIAGALQHLAPHEVQGALSVGKATMIDLPEVVGALAHATTGRHANPAPTTPPQPLRTVLLPEARKHAQDRYGFSMPADVILDDTTGLLMVALEPMHELTALLVGVIPRDPAQRTLTFMATLDSRQAATHRDVPARVVDLYRTGGAAALSAFTAAVEGGTPLDDCFGAVHAAIAR